MSGISDQYACIMYGTSIRRNRACADIYPCSYFLAASTWSTVGILEVAVRARGPRNRLFIHSINKSVGWRCHGLVAYHVLGYQYTFMVSHVIHYTVQLQLPILQNNETCLRYHDCRVISYLLDGVLCAVAWREYAITMGLSIRKLVNTFTCRRGHASSLGSK